MDLKKAILERRTIRSYNDKEVNREDVIELLNAAVYAPNHQLRQTQRFIYIDGEAKDKLFNELDSIFEGVDPEIARLEYRKKVIFNAKAILIIINEKKDDDPVWTFEEYGASSALIQNFQLLAFERGIGVCWKTKVFQGPLIDYINVKDNEMVAGALTLGYYEEAPSPIKREKPDSKITYLT